MNIETLEHNILSKCDYFTTVHLWPLQAKLDPRNWLSNFTDSEKPFAFQLLNSFLYFSEPLVDQLLYSAFHRLSMHVSQQNASNDWLSFLRNCIFVTVTGERPNATDSGYLLARKARQVLGIPENQFLVPENALDYLLTHRGCPVVFLDDFVGSGNQFLVTWNRKHEVQSQSIAFKDLLSSQSDCFYSPLICTDFGAHQIAKGDAMRSLSAAPSRQPFWSFSRMATNRGYPLFKNRRRASSGWA